jgi:hypothetical protein
MQILHVSHKDMSPEQNKMFGISETRADAGNSALRLFLLLIRIMINCQISVLSDRNYGTAPRKNQGSLEWTAELQRLGTEVSTEAYCILGSDAA